MASIKETIKEIKDIPLFLNCNDEQLKEASRYVEKVFFQDNKHIYRAGDPSLYIYIINSGIVELLLPVSPDKTHTSSVLRKNDIFGIGEIFFDKYYLDAHSLSKTTLFRIRKKDFFSHILTEHCIVLNILTDFAHIIKIAATQGKWDNAKSNVLVFLTTYCKKHGREVAGNLIVDLTITHEEISHILNISREHVSRIVSELKKDTVITIKKGILQIDSNKAEKIIGNNEIMNYMKF